MSGHSRCRAPAALIERARAAARTLAAHHMSRRAASVAAGLSLGAIHNLLERDHAGVRACRALVRAAEKLSRPRRKPRAYTPKQSPPASPAAPCARGCGRTQSWVRGGRIVSDEQRAWCAC